MIARNPSVSPPNSGPTRRVDPRLCPLLEIDLDVSPSCGEWRSRAAALALTPAFCAFGVPYPRADEAAYASWFGGPVEVLFESQQ